MADKRIGLEIKLRLPKPAFKHVDPQITFEEVDISHIKPRPRVYTST